MLDYYVSFGVSKYTFIISYAALVLNCYVAGCIFAIFIFLLNRNKWLYPLLFSISWADPESISNSRHLPGGFNTRCDWNHCLRHLHVMTPPLLKAVFS